MVNRIVLFALVIISLSCLSQDCGKCPLRKKRYRYCKSRTVFDSNSNLNESTKTIFIYDQSENSNSAVGNYLILSQNGGAYISCPLCALPEDSVVCDLSKGFFGSWVISGKLVELTIFSQWARYYVLYGEINEDGIRFTHRKSRSSLQGR